MIEFIKKKDSKSGRGNYYEVHVTQNDIGCKTYLRIAIDEDIMAGRFDNCKYMMIGFDRDDPLKMFIIPSDDSESGFKVNYKPSGKVTHHPFVSVPVDGCGDFVGYYDIEHDPRGAFFVDQENRVER